MKRIAIFIDGTWNRPDAKNPTNVLRLARCVRQEDPRDGTRQQVIYSPGVGAGLANSRLGRWIDRLFGGALGWGLIGIMEAVYRDLVLAYEPGDEIYIFGFSRGAFAARSLAGMIRSCGICAPSEMHRVPEAVQHYKTGGPPETEKGYAFRAGFAPRTPTSLQELNQRKQTHPELEPSQLILRYVGVWDTVKALGLPLVKSLNARYRFHDAELSSTVWSARHAIAMDERRYLFPASPWAPLDDLNAAVAVERSLNPGIEDSGAPPRYQQQWFPGVHGAVGGGGERTDLSTIAMRWIALGADHAGLALDWTQFRAERAEYDPQGPLTNAFGPVGLAAIVLGLIKVDRAGPPDDDGVSLSILDRVRADPNYHPPRMVSVAQRLRGLSEAEYETLRAWCIARDGGETHQLGRRTMPAPDRPAKPPDM